ncbi:MULTISPECIES: gp16 family protein [Hafnia]|uniref:gp16 family protein n=1 Tax=Hafnia TaxID=568 RepID=UPI001C03E099|nr:regulatory protein GemA [Hafnia paralvei]MBU2673548.1 regulatory protein GemA [Hafnia paralvei]
MNRSNLIKLIHIARRQMHLDDETYRLMLSSVVSGKTSCRDMSLGELEKVLAAFKERGFKASSNKKKTAVKPRSNIVGKIVAIWHTMHQQGFIEHDTPAALDSYVQRTTRNLNGGEGIARVSWLRDQEAVKVLESLKRWHQRCMLEKLTNTDFKQTYTSVSRHFLLQQGR